MTVQPDARFVASHPAHFVALGFGAGLAPRAPGTAGTLAAWVLGWALAALMPPAAVATLAAAMFVVGVWACSVTGRNLGVSDHGAMVWDEMAAFLIVLAVLPRELLWQVAGFVLFRLFDVLKPPPIRWVERRFKGGFGVMLDDVIAAALALLVLALARRLVL